MKPSAETKSAERALLIELRDLKKRPAEGFIVECDERDVFKWTVGIFGPPGTAFAGGYFRAVLRFPRNYPFAPPTFRFVSRMFHPNVYPDGNICISILEQPGASLGGGTSAEKWNPTRNVRTVLLSIIALLDRPNVQSPANLEAAALYAKWKESGGKADEWLQRVKRLVDESKVEAAKDGVQIPQTVAEYCAKPPAPTASLPDELADLSEDHLKARALKEIESNRFVQGYEADSSDSPRSSSHKSEDSRRPIKK